MIVSYLYLLRVPIIVGATLVILPVAAVFTDLDVLLQGLFDVHGRDIWGVSTAAFMLSLTLLTTSFLVAAYADQRMGVVRLHAQYPIPTRWYLVACLFALPTLWAAARVGQGPRLPFYAWSAAGLITSVVLYFAARRLVSLLDTIEALRALSRWLCRHPDLGAGYVDLADGSFLPGHRFALGLMTFSALLYWLIGDPNRILVPTLVYALLLLIVLCWAFAGAAFFLDRYRVPVLLPVVVLAMATGFSGGSDHYFRLRAALHGQPDITPGGALAAPRPGAPPSRSAIVVAANGGGIQAAAWTARVLTGLERTCRARYRSECRFAQSVRLISSVSGGTVGAMYVIDSYADGQLPPDHLLDVIVSRAEQSSLRHVGWGLLYRDLLRPVFPRSAYEDRGSMLEDAWQREVRLDRGLQSWRADVGAGLRPAAIFNATISDTGERLLMGTANPAQAPGRRNFEALYPGKDLSIVTAARLSAAFPYVSPAARADTSEPEAVHVVDGGYYDVYGVASLVDWLDQALLENQRNPASPTITRVFVVQVRGAPPDREGQGERRGWFYQAYAPLAALLGARDTGQLAHNDQEVSLLRRAWADRVAISSAVFQFCGGSPPLSWHMTAAQVRAIDTEWEAEERYRSTDAVMDFLIESDAAPGLPPASVYIPGRCRPTAAPQQDSR